MKIIALFFAGTIISMALVSCLDDSLIESLNEKGIDISNPDGLSRRILTEDDLIYSLQTDQLGLLINSIELVDSDRYEISLTVEDAMTLGISDTIYNKALQVVDAYNESLNVK